MTMSTVEQPPITPAAPIELRQVKADLSQRSPMRMAWARFRRDRAAVLGLIIVIAIVLFALSADLFARYVTGKEPQQQSIVNRLAPIGQNGYLLGADDLGRDVATRLAYGARVSLGVAGLALMVALVFGVSAGLVAGYYGGWVDGSLMRVVDILLSIPTIFLLLLVATFWRLGPVELALLIAAVGWMTLARLVRGEVLAIKEREFVQAAVALGIPNRQIIVRHVLPNVASVILVWVSLTLPGLILAEATLSYLGFGVQPPTPSWGNMLSMAQRVWYDAPHLVVLPGLAIYIAVYAINLMGNGLRDALDPRLIDAR